MAAKLKKGDKVVVLAGKDKGKEGTITSVDPKAGKAVVEGINMAIRHTRQSQTEQGGRLQTWWEAMQGHDICKPFLDEYTPAFDKMMVYFRGK